MPTQFTLFGPSDKHSLITGGFCISVFAIMRKDGKVLLVKPRENSRWTEEWAPNWRLYSPEALSNEYKSWRFPSSYIKEGESPDEALSRVLTQQLGIENYRMLSSKLLNFYGPSRRYPDRMHWDYCFIYEVRSDESPSIKPWYSSIEFLDLLSLDEKAFGSGQGGLLEKLA